HRLPTIEHPLPALGGIEPSQWMAGCGRGLRVPRVALDRLAQRRAPWGMRLLIGHELAFGRDREPGEVLGPTERPARHARVVQLFPVERIAIASRREQPFETTALAHDDRGAIVTLLHGNVDRERHRGAGPDVSPDC